MPSLPDRLTEIDESMGGDHVKLIAADDCYFWREYTSGKNFRFSSTNQLIFNLKIEPTKPSGQLSYKRAAIRECATFFRGAINTGWLGTATLVPVPPSKAKGHADYDDRMTQVCRLIAPGLDIRELILQTESLEAAHKGSRPTVDELLEVYEIDEAVAAPTPRSIAIFDDVLTAGVHYRAMHTVLSARFPQVPIYGFFVARRIFADPFEAFDVLGPE